MCYHTNMDNLSGPQARALIVLCADRSNIRYASAATLGLRGRALSDLVRRGYASTSTSTRVSNGNGRKGSKYSVATYRVTGEGMAAMIRLK